MLLGLVLFQETDILNIHLVNWFLPIKKRRIRKKFMGVRLFFLVICFSFGMRKKGGDARYHHHHRTQKHPPPQHASGISMPPVGSPAPSPGDSWNNYTVSGSVYDLRVFGAIGDGVSDDTKAFEAAWDAACATESGVLLVPHGYIFLTYPTIFTGPCQTGLIFQVNGTIMPPDGPESWPKNNSKRQWLVFYRVDDISMQGGGLIDGRGQQWWNLPCKPHRVANGTILRPPCDSPVAIRFFMSKNITVQGIKIRDSPKFHFRFDNCRNIRIESIQITSPASSPNTDGIHIENTDNVGIYNSVISTGDDCVSVGSGCFDVDIKNITCGPSHGISIGSLGNHKSRACAYNITVRDSVIKNSDNGVRIKTWQGGYGSVSGVTFNNISMENVRNPIIIDQFYCLSTDCANVSSAVSLSDIQYVGIKGTYDVRGPPMHLACSDTIPCTNITFSDVELLPAQGDMVLDPFCWNAYGELQTLTIPPVSCLLQGMPRSALDNNLEYTCS